MYLCSNCVCEKFVSVDDDSLPAWVCAFGCVGLEKCYFGVGPKNVRKTPAGFPRFMGILHETGTHTQTDDHKYDLYLILITTKATLFSSCCPRELRSNMWVFVVWCLSVCRMICYYTYNNIYVACCVRFVCEK